jgi:hypothetical protein
VATVVVKVSERHVSPVSVVSRGDHGHDSSTVGVDEMLKHASETGRSVHGRVSGETRAAIEHAFDLDMARPGERRITIPSDGVTDIVRHRAPTDRADVRDVGVNRPGDGHGRDGVDQRAQREPSVESTSHDQAARGERVDAGRHDAEDDGDIADDVVLRQFRPDYLDHAPEGEPDESQESDGGSHRRDSGRHDAPDVHRDPPADRGSAGGDDRAKPGDIASRLDGKDVPGKAAEPERPTPSAREAGADRHGIDRSDVHPTTDDLLGEGAVRELGFDPGREPGVLGDRFKPGVLDSYGEVAKKLDSSRQERAKAASELGTAKYLVAERKALVGFRSETAPTGERTPDTMVRWGPDDPGRLTDLKALQQQATISSVKHGIRHGSRSVSADPDGAVVIDGRSKGLTEDIATRAWESRLREGRTMAAEVHFILDDGRWLTLSRDRGIRGGGADV